MDLAGSRREGNGRNDLGRMRWCFMLVLAEYCIVYAGAAIVASILQALLFDDDDPEPSI